MSEPDEAGATPASGESAEQPKSAWDFAALDAAGAALAGKVAREPEVEDDAEPAEPEFVMPDLEERADAEHDEPEPEPEAAPEPEHEPEAAPEPEPEPATQEPEAQDLDAAAVTAALEAADLANASPEEIEDSGLPDLTDDREFDGALESVLLVVDSPIHEDQLSSALEQPVKRVKEALSRISNRYTESGSGIDLRRVGDGWRFYTRDRFAPFVEKLLLDGQRAKLTRAALETLAVIAYRQPVTRARIAAVRGVNVDGVIRTLVARGLIEEIGTDGDTGGILYRTTELFLERLGLPSLADLPPIAPLLPEVDAIDDV